MSKVFINFKKIINPHELEAQQTPSRISMKKNMTRYTTVKLKTSDKKKNLKISQRKKAHDVQGNKEKNESCCCCCCIASVVSDSVRPQRWQPMRIPRSWDSPGKNTGVGCHFLLQCMKVKNESEVAHSCLTLRNPMECSPLSSSVRGIFQSRVLEWGVITFSDSLGYPTLNKLRILRLAYSWVSTPNTKRIL